MIFSFCPTLFLVFSLIIPGYTGAQVDKDITLDKQVLEDRIKGSFYAANLGDTLGYPSELMKLHRGVQFLSATEIYKKWPNGICKLSDVSPIIYSDDTAMALVTAEGIIETLEIIDTHLWNIRRCMNTGMNILAKRYLIDMGNPRGWAAPFRAPGNGCLTAIKRLTYENEQSPHWWQAGLREWQDAQQSGKLVGAGCGSVMRAYPFGLFFYQMPAFAAEVAAQHSLITHGHPSAQAACAALATGVAYAVQGKRESEWFVSELLEKMVQAAERYDQETADKMRSAIKNGIYNGSIEIGFADELHEQLWHEKTLKNYLGWRADDAIAAVCYIVAACPHSLKKALYMGVHSPGDSDSVASMVGAIMGALHGFEHMQECYADLHTLEGAKRMDSIVDRFVKA